jgi:tetratricopeptide (TPR) repeat protein
MATIEARLALLTPSTLDVLGIASVIGREFGTELVAASSGTGEPEVATAVEELVKRRLVGERGAGVYDFSHDSIREVAYTRLGADRRRLLHRGIAQAQIASAGSAPASASTIAKHLERGGFIEGAIPFYRLAAEHALGIYAGIEAVAHYEQALELLGRLPPSAGHLLQEIELRTALCVALVNLEMFSGPRMLQEYARLSGLCHRAGVSPGPPAMRTLAIALLMQGEVAETARIGEQLLAAVPPTGDPVLLAEAQYVLGVSAFWRGDPEISARHFRAGLDAYRPAHAGEHVRTYGQDAGVICGVRLAMALCVLDQPEAARQTLAEAVALAETLRHPHTLAYAWQIGAWALIELGNEAAARRQIESAVKVTEAHQLSGWPIRNTALLGYLVGRAGEVDRGIAMMRSAAEQWTGKGWRLLLPYDRGLLARLYLDAGRAAEGLGAIEEGLTTARDTGQAFWNAELLRLKGELLEISGAPPAESRQAFSDALELARAQGATALVRRAEESLQSRRNAGRTLAE